VEQYGDRPTDQLTNGPTDEESYRGALLAPKKGEKIKEMNKGINQHLKKTFLSFSLLLVRCVSIIDFLSIFFSIQSD
jgi:hypothetical protein